MPITPQVTFRNLDPSAAITTLIEDRLTKLSELHDTVSACEVVVESPNRQNAKGRAFHVRLRLSVRGTEPVVSEENHEDCAVAIREAFNAARRQIEHHAQRSQAQRRPRTD